MMKVIFKLNNLFKALQLMGPKTVIQAWVCLNCTFFSSSTPALSIS